MARDASARIDRRRLGPQTRSPRAVGPCLGIAIAALSGAYLLACQPAESKRPNIVLISLDTTRADHTSLHGYARDTTPNLVAWAADGARFDVAYSPTSTTGPTHASVFTSLYPWQHGVIKNGRVLGDESLSLAEVLREAGYQTAGFVASFVLNAKFGYAQGFDHWDDDFDRATARHSSKRWEGHAVEGGFDRPGSEVTDHALAWLDANRRRGKPFLLFLHYFDAHNPYAPPAEFLARVLPPSGRRGRPDRHALYDGGIAYADHEVGRFLSGLGERGLGDETIVVVFGDHGEGLMEHGIEYHGEAIYEEQVRVPFAWRWPGHIVPAQAHAAPIELLDIAPTLFELIGQPRPDAHAHGRSLAPLLLGQSSESERERPIPLYRRHYAAPTDRATSGKPVGEQFGLRQGRWKYIDAPLEQRRELYDLESDPDERENLVEVRPETADVMQRATDAWRAEGSGNESSGEELSDDDRARLKALGYAE